MSIRPMTVTAMLTALLCIIGPMTLPIGPVPLSLTTAVLMLIALLLGPGRASLCCCVYLTLGLMGMPVFSGFTGGVGTLLGPTGGFLLGYLPLTALCGWIGSRTERRLPQVVGFISGTILLCLLGTAWYCWQSGTAPAAAVTVCVLPFLPWDAVKIMTVLTGGNAVKARLKRAGLV